MNITTEANLAAQWILNEKVIAYPTEGVWGIGGLNTSENCCIPRVGYCINNNTSSEDYTGDCITTNEITTKLSTINHS